jgi:parallel beta-helix repeat protein
VARSRWARRQSTTRQRLALVAAALTAHARLGIAGERTTYYVRALGDDSHDGLGRETAFASICPTGRLRRNSGDRVIVGPGIYHEGNIEPRGSGTPDAPIVFLGDATGFLTGDPPGAVTIIPPNAKDSTTGFIVYGRHDIRIEGFEIDGAKDAGIQVRPRPRTGADSAQITLVNNGAQHGHIGIQVTAVDDVSVIGNRLIGDGAGLTLQSGASGTLRPVVSANTIDQNSNTGIWIHRTSGCSIAQNTLGSYGFSLRLGNAESLPITQNHIVAGHARMYGDNMQVTDNVFEAGAGMSATMGRLVFARNRMPGGEDFSLLIRGRDAQVLVLENQLPRLYVSGAVQLDLERNEAATVQAKVGAITAIDNEFVGSVRLFGGLRLEATNNSAASLTARALEVLVQNNSLSGPATIGGNRATINNNRAASLSLVRASGPGAIGQDDRSGPFRVTGNTIGGVVRIQQGMSPAVVENNVSGGMLRIIARRELRVRHNQANGISCVLLAPDSQLVLADNISHGSSSSMPRRRQPAPAPYAGLLVAGAGSAVVENNTSSDSADCGLVARRINQLTIVGNTFRSNGAGGISVETRLAGDCNGDLHVAINELVSVVGVALETRPLHECDAADVNGDGAVTVDEIVQSVDAALELSAGTDSFVEIRSNHVEDNGRFGINVFAAGRASAIDNRVVHNGGIPIALHGRGLSDHTEVADNVGLGGAQGLLLEDVAGARVRDNVIFSNREAGILLRASPGAAVVNSLIYANRNDGIAVGLGSALPASTPCS